MKATVRHDDFMRERLADAEFAAGYVQAALEDGDPGVLLLALRRIADARGGMAKLARVTGLSREALYRTLAKTGNPRLSTLTSILEATRLRLAVVPDDNPRLNALTPPQAFELYRANARLALEVIDAAIESTAKLRKLQVRGEEQARSMHKKGARTAAEAGDLQTLMAAGQTVAQEAVEQSMQYWSQMFEMISEIQKRLFSLMENQMAGVRGVKEAKAAMAMMPDLTKMQNVVSAMQGVMSSGGTAFDQMVMGDIARKTQNAAPGTQSYHRRKTG